MTHLFLERKFDAPLDKQAVIEMARSGAWCFEQYRVDWHGSLLASDGQTMVCRFEGLDAESIRQALAKIDTDMRICWTGTVHEVPAPGTPNVVVERIFDEPVTLDDVQAKEDAGQWCLDAHNVKFVRTYFSSDRKRMLCLYSAPDAEAVASAQRKADMPVDRVWSCQTISMADAAG